MSVRRSVAGSAYPPDWTDIALRCKTDAGNCCERCKHGHDPASGHTLTVHHLDMNPSNNRWWNLAALCQRCHLHIQHKVVMSRPFLFEHSEWFKPHVAGYYAHCRGEDDSRAAVMPRIAEILGAPSP